MPQAYVRLQKLEEAEMSGTAAEETLQGSGKVGFSLFPLPEANSSVTPARFVKYSSKKAF